MTPTISPAPSAEEAAAIAVAIEALWPQPVAAVSPVGAEPRSVAWRHSGRWWRRDRFAPTDRPW